MTEKEQLWYLIDKLLDDKYQIKDFCNEFTRIYDLEVDYDELSTLENKLFNELSSMTSRFSENEEDLKIPNMYYNEKDIISKAKEIVSIIKANNRWRDYKITKKWNMDFYLTKNNITETSHIKKC